MTGQEIIELVKTLCATVIGLSVLYLIYKDFTD